MEGACFEISVMASETMSCCLAVWSSLISSQACLELEEFSLGSAAHALRVRQQIRNRSVAFAPRGLR